MIVPNMFPFLVFMDFPILGFMKTPGQPVSLSVSVSRLSPASPWDAPVAPGAGSRGDGPPRWGHLEDRETIGKP